MVIFGNFGYYNNAAARTTARVTDNSTQITAKIVDGNLQIDLNTMVGYTAFQLSLVMTDGATAKNLQLSEERRANHVVSTGHTDGRQIIVAYSPDNSLLGGQQRNLANCSDTFSG